MSNEPFFNQDHNNQIIQEDQEVFTNNGTKNPLTTKFTKLTNTFTLGESLVLGKNALVQSNTEFQLDSNDVSSEASFEQRLQFEHEKFLPQNLRKYYQMNGQFDQSSFIDESTIKKSYELIKQIEERSLYSIEKKFGSLEAQKTKILIKFLKRSQDMFKIYFHVMRSLTFSLRICSYFLLKESLLFYLKGLQQIKKNSSTVSLSAIEEYVKQNYKVLCNQIQSDQKFSAFHYRSHDHKMKTQFQQFIQMWMEGFFLCKQGFPTSRLYKKEKNISKRHESLVKQQKGQKRKKIKKW